MATSTDLQLCDALCEVIHAAFNALQPVRVHVPDWSQRKDLKNLRVEVCAGSTPTELDDSEQDGIFVEWTVIVSCAISVSRGTTATIDALLDQVEQIRQLIQEQELDLLNGASVHCQSFEYLTRFDPDLLGRQTVKGADIYSGTFLSVIHFPFREIT